MAFGSILDSLRELRHTRTFGIRFADSKGWVKRVPYSELYEHCHSFAKRLIQKGVEPGEAVILVMTDPESAITAILGSMLAGCPPAPIYPPASVQAVPGFLKFVRHVAERSGATFLISDPEPYMFLGNIPHEFPQIRGVERFHRFYEASSGDELTKFENSVAFFQFTSGSTSAPKGVTVMHSGLMANLQMIRKAARMDQRSCVVTWLPVYHDMGLIGTVLNAISLPCELVVLPPMTFLKRPRLWLELISQFRGTHTAAPNFAYGICARRVDDLRGIDLSSMTTFICGAEPVVPVTMQRFVEHFEPAGLHPGSMVPAYGLAEATLAVTFTPFMRGMISQEVDLDHLASQNKAVPVNQSDQRKTVIASCGFPLEGVSVRIVSEEGKALPEWSVGEIQISGPTVTPGYIGDPQATREAKTRDGWLRTGDLGFLANGELYPCGRIKDLIIIRGKNFYAHDIEQVASEVPGVRMGNVVAFSIRDESSAENLVVIAESRLEKDTRHMAQEIHRKMSGTFGIHPHEVLIVPSGTLPKTSSGKLKRFEMRSMYLKGELAPKSQKWAGWQAAIKSQIGFLKKKT